MDISLDLRINEQFLAYIGALEKSEGLLSPRDINRTTPNSQKNASAELSYTLFILDTLTPIQNEVLLKPLNYL
jgi:hypothetical protein